MQIDFGHGVNKSGCVSVTDVAGSGDGSGGWRGVVIVVFCGADNVITFYIVWTSDFLIHSDIISKITSTEMTRHILILSIVGMVLVSLVNARYIPEEELRSKRQTGDIKTAEYQAWLALGGIVPPGCVEVACGVVDVHASGKKKRSDISSDDIRRSILAQRLIRFAAERLAKTE
ncbi:Hypothetical predicted protein [Octopus vulgaris]|uniref:Uncharacterized protein n=1 Tax=Octopus vulgaris TaxID=6645 RepID=A0AA36F3X2_OCTVU|nr:Hypothetical predicted protein [Octopus vulgaris]